MNVLSINSGSSSLKFGLFESRDGDVRAIATGAVEGIGASESRTWIKDAHGKLLRESTDAVKRQQDAFETFMDLYLSHKFPMPEAVGHRIVHGGAKLREHQRITPEVMQQLYGAAAFAPLHVPSAIELIRLAVDAFPDAAQIACFDTAFHRVMPEEAARFALPERFWTAGVRRYGFHGLSCESIMHQLGAAAPARIIVAHLGSGASVTAIEHGKSVDTTMGLTPTGGIVMATRTGDLDPGLMLYIVREGGCYPDDLEKLFDKESGMLGVSGKTGSMRELRERAAEDERARMAIKMFCRSVKKAIGSFVALLGGLDLLVFAGGIGENDAASREEICRGLGPMGIELDEAANEKAGPLLNTRNSAAQIRVVQSDEDAQIARIAAGLVAAKA